MSSNRAERNKRLAELLKRKGKSQKDNTEDLYEEVSEGEYDAYHDDENFVEDDDKGGYVKGQESEEEMVHSDDYEEERSPTSSKRKRKAVSAKREVKEPPVSRNLANMFAKINQKTTPKEAKQESTSSKATDDDLMNDIFSEMDQDLTPRKTAINPAKRARSMATSRYNSPLSYTVSRSSAPSPVQKESPVEEHTELQKTIDATAPASAPGPAVEKPTDAEEKEEEFYNATDADVDMADTSMEIDTKPKENVVETLSVHQLQSEERKMKFKEDRPDLQTWRNAEDNMFSADTATELARDDSQTLEVLEKDDSLHIWWYDAYERYDKGYVYLFGKVFNKSLKKYVSCCVTVRNVERNIFVLPREYALGDDGKPTEEEVSMAEVHGEISELCSRHKIHQWASKPVTRKYAFELPNVPMETDYLKMVYSYEQPSLPADIQGKTFSRIFGANTGPLEHFLVKRDIMGPCWLKVDNAKIVNANDTWCKVQVIVDDPKTVNPIRDEHGNGPTEIPPLVVLSISLRTVVNQQKGVNEIIAASGVVCPEVKIDEPTPIEEQKKMRFAIIRQLTNVPYPAGFNDMAVREKQQNGFSIQIERTEGALLNFLLAKIHVCDPDVIVGHNFAGFDLDVLLHRMKALGTQNWHKLGRLRRKNWPKLQTGAGGAGESTYQERMIMSGRLVCDTYLASKDLIRSKSYRLSDLAQSQLKIVREDIEFDKITKYYENAQSLLHMVKHCSFDAFLSTALMFKLQILPLTKQLTNLAGNLWSRTMTGARAERNEFLLLHEFHRQKYICPDKAQFGKSQAAVIEAIELDQDEEAEQIQTRKSKSSRRKPAYTGGLVLEPKKGFYDKYVLLLDFNSLYPSIIQEYNVCFTTVERQKQITADEEERVPDIPDKDIPAGVLPRLIKTLVDRRRQVKKLMKDPKISEATMMQYDIRQKALKLTANSMYGCLGFSHSRFYAKPLAMLITHKGREILQNTVDLAGNLDLNVIYGDTDSIMVYTNENDISKVREMGNLLKKRVNEHYSLLEIDIDGMFKHMLLLKKKKYAALLVEEKPDGTLVESVETKGLDLVRRDWCDLSHDISSRVLAAILSDKDREEVVEDIHAYLRLVGEQIRQGEIPLEKYVINKQLTKNPQEYADAKSQPHVQVALRMRQAGISVRAGDTVPYVICLVENMPSGTKSGFAERAYHPDDVMRNNMKLDIGYYLNQQIHPPVARLCAPIDGTDASRLAECLGLDPSKYNVGMRSSEADQSEEFATLDSQISDAERFKNCERLTVKCEHCQTPQEFAGVVREQGEGQTLVSGLQCTSCGNIMSRGCIGSQMILAIRKHIRKYYEGWLICDDTTCRNRTRQMSVFGRRCLRDNCHGAMAREYTDKQLYTQLLYYSSLVDTDKAKTNAYGTSKAVQVEAIVNRYNDIYAAVKRKADAYLDRSGYRHVDLAKLLSLVTI